MDNQNHTRSKSPTLRQRIIQALIIVLPILVLNIGRFWLRDKCSVIDCASADWRAIQEIVVRNSKSRGTEYRLNSFQAYPKIDSTGTLKDIRFLVYYVSTKQTKTSTGLVFPVKRIRFDDKNLWVYSDTSKSLSFISLPSQENLKRFQRVRISPQDVIEITWDLASGQLEGQIMLVLIELGFESNELEVDSHWEVAYLGQPEKRIRYYLDTQNGKILLTK